MVQNIARQEDVYSIEHNGVGYVNCTPDMLLQSGVPQVKVDDLLTQQIISTATRSIDDLCDKVYTRSPSRSARYDRKLAESLKYKAAGWTGNATAADYPYIHGEAAQRADMTMRQLAEAIIVSAAAFDQLGAAAETARAQLKKDVTAAADHVAKQAAADTIVAAFAALVNQS